MNPSATGVIFDIQRCSMHDGPGIRTTVFLKGCPLSCKWCHNPESQALHPQLAFYAEKCSLCGRCESLCPQVHEITGNRHFVNYSGCQACGACVKACPSHALSIFGNNVSVADIMETVRKDSVYYQQTGGGLTVSGGEPFLQHDFLTELLASAKSEQFHTCVETSGFTSREHLVKALPYVDLFLFDYKVTSPSLHKEFTGVDHKLILDNLEFLYRQDKQVLLRCPIIPGYNDTQEHFSGIHRIETAYPDLAGIEILPYHNLGRGKAAAIGQNYEISSPTADTDLKKQWKEKMAACGCSHLILQSF